MTSTSVEVTGARRGFGRATAKRSAASRAQVVANDLDVDAAQHVAAEIGAYAVPGDLACDSGVTELVAQARRRLSDDDPTAPVPSCS